MYCSLQTNGWRPEKYRILESSKPEVAESFCYLDDKLCPGGGRELAIIARTRAAWRKIHELLPLLSFPQSH